MHPSLVLSATAVGFAILPPPLRSLNRVIAGVIRSSVMSKLKSSVGALILLLAVGGSSIVILGWRHARLQKHWTMSIQKEAPYPPDGRIDSITIFDHGNIPKIVLLHRKTHSDSPVINWIDRIGYGDSDELVCIVDGRPIAITNELQVYFATNSSPPLRLGYPTNIPVPHSAVGKWTKLTP